MSVKISATQLKCFKRSPLDWIMQYVENLKLPSTVDVLWGTLVHAWVEHLLKGLTVEPEAAAELSTEQVISAEVVAIALCSRHKNLIENLQDLRTEITFEIPFMDDLAILGGRVDIMGTNPATGQTAIYDIKTTSANLQSGRFYGLVKAEDLLNDIQMNMYALATHIDKPNQEDFHLGHLQVIKLKKYGQIQGYDYREVFADCHIQNIRKFMHELEVMLKEMKNLQELYQRTDIYGVISYYEKDIVDLANRRNYGQDNPFWAHYNGFETLADLKTRMLQK